MNLIPVPIGVLAADLEKNVLFAFNVVREPIHECLHGLTKLQALNFPLRLKNEKFQRGFEIQ
jgi:hypothetical protein